LNRIAGLHVNPAPGGASAHEHARHDEGIAAPFFDDAFKRDPNVPSLRGGELDFVAAVGGLSMLQGFTLRRIDGEGEFGLRGEKFDRVKRVAGKRRGRGEGEADSSDSNDDHGQRRREREAKDGKRFGAARGLHESSFAASEVRLGNSRCESGASDEGGFEQGREFVRVVREAGEASGEARAFGQQLE
jgi:hypothetical protein